MNAPVQSFRTPCLLQTFDIQVFDADRSIPVNVAPGEFVKKISLLVRDMIVCLLRSALCLFPVLREALFPGNASLELPDCIQRPLIKPGIFDRCTITINGKRVQTNINAD